MLTTEDESLPRAKSRGPTTAFPDDWRLTTDACSLVKARIAENEGKKRE
ncbi:MAG TPA: hypothetical protein VF840_12430 [Terriglobales bacterium]